MVMSEGRPVPGPGPAVDAAWLRSYLAGEARRAVAVRVAVGRALVDAVARSAPPGEVAELVERLDCPDLAAAATVVEVCGTVIR